jgi:hypothetical protein
MSAPFSSTRGIIRASSFPSSACVIPCGEVSALSTESAAMQFESSSNGQSEDRGIANDDAESSAPRHRPTVGPLTNNNVGEVVAKAKKAAASLWMILHAQVRIDYVISIICYTRKFDSHRFNIVLTLLSTPVSRVVGITK